MCLTWLGGFMPHRTHGPQHTPEQRAQYEDDGFVYVEIMRELEQPAACDKHKWLVEDADLAQELKDMTEIDELQRRIVANGGTVIQHGGK